MDWARILAYVTGMVDQELLARNEYLVAENRILKARSNGRLKLSDAERATLGEIGNRLGRKVLGEVANVARPDTILAWYRKLVARNFHNSKARRSPGRPRIKREVDQLIVRMARENRDWGYDNVLRRHALLPAPERRRTTTWAAFIRTHLALLVGTEPPGGHCGDDHSSRRAVDAADRSECDHRREPPCIGTPPSPTLPSARHMHSSSGCARAGRVVRLGLTR